MTGSGLFINSKNGITLLSARDPEGQCRRIANAVGIFDKTLYFCPSPLFGYGLDVLLEKLENSAPNSAILCVEADEDLWSLNEEIKMKNEKKIYFSNIVDPEKLCSFVREKWGTRSFRRVEMVRLTGGWQLHSELYKSIFETLANEIANNWSNVITITKLGRNYIKNFLINLSLINKFKSISELNFGNSPVLVLGAGPSLDEYLDKNKKEIHNYKIICVDTCLGALKDRNITPDLVVVLESQHWNMRDFVGCKNWNVPVSYDMSALPASCNVLSGDKYLFFTAWTELEIFKRLKDENLLPQEIPPLGSVGVTAMYIAKMLTTKEIKHAGFDFSFTMDKYHARGAPSHREKLNKHNRFGGLIGFEAFREGIIKEGDKYTSPVMKKYKELFDREYKEKNITQRRNDAEKSKDDLKEFIQNEIERLIRLRDILTDKNENENLEEYLKSCDYLWAHFPDYAGGVSPNLTDISFLNRVRIEIDNMLKYLERVA